MIQLRASPVTRNINAVWQRVPNIQKIQEVSAY